MDPFQSFIDSIAREILEPVVTLVALAAFLVFLWGVIEYIRSGSDGGKGKEEGRQHMIWGIVGLAIIFAANGLVDMIQSTADSVLP